MLCPASNRRFVPLSDSCTAANSISSAQARDIGEIRETDTGFILQPNAAGFSPASGGRAYCVSKLLCIFSTI
jgi:hypothetical protein